MHGNESFAGCLVEGDSDALERARKLPTKALAMSLALESALIGAMLLRPLVTPGVLPRQYVVTPTHPYGGHADPHAARHHGQPHPPIDFHHPLPPQGLYQPPTIPPHISESPDQPGIETAMDLENRSAGDKEGVPGDGRCVSGGLGTGPPPMPPVAPPRTPSAQVRMSEGVMEAQLIQRAEPAYPAIARTMHLSGVVQLRATIGTDGHVRRIEVASGSPILARAAIEAVNQWRYRPTLLSGSAVEVETIITVKYVLE